MKDIHKKTAADLFDVEEYEVTPTQRRIGKTINYGFIYGATEKIYNILEDEELLKFDFSKLEEKVLSLQENNNE